MNRFLLTAGLMLGLATAPLTSAQELLSNPDFNGGGAGWGSFGAAGFNDFFGGNEHASLFMDNPSNFGGVFQTGIPATAGATYQFDLLDVRIEENANASLRFGLEYYQGDDSTAAGAFDIVPIPHPPTGDGLSFSMTGVAPAGTAFVRPIIQFDNVMSTASGQENAFVFSASLTEVIPEPSTTALALIGLVAIRASRSKR